MLDKLRRLWAGVLVVAKAAPTWLVTAATIITVFAEEIAKILPAPWADTVTTTAVTAVAAIYAILAIIRRVTPALPSERGILPPTTLTR